METYRRVLYSPSAVNLAVVEEVPNSEIVEARRKAFTLSNSLQDPSASKNADVPLEWQRLKNTKLQTQSPFSRTRSAQ